MTDFIGQIDIGNFLKACKQFEEYRQNVERPQDRAGAVQAFEYTYELAWKTMKRILNQQGISEINSPRSCFREAARNDLISDSEKWLQFIEMRNLTVHTYSEDMLDKVVEGFEDFSKALKDFISNLEKLK